MAISKKTPSRRRLPHEKGPLKRFLTVLLILFVCAGVLVGFWFLSQMGPKKVDYSELNVGSKEVSADVLALKEKSLENEARFEEILAMREAEAQDIALLKQALEAHEQYVNALDGYDAAANQRKVSLARRYQDFASRRDIEESRELEAEARTLAAEGNFNEARTKFMEALSIQKRINETYPLSPAANVGRVTRLQREAQVTQAQPLLERSQQYEKEADALIEAREWEQAEVKLRQAMEVQDKLNREYRGSNQASVARFEGLRTKLVGILSGRSQIEIEELSKLADARLAEGNMLQAAKLFQEVSRLQKALNDTYPDSPHASSELVAEYLRKSQTAQSYDLGLEIERNNDQLRQLLAKRRTYEAGEVIVRLRRDLLNMKETFPRSSLNDEQLELKVRYLNLVQNDLGFIQDRIFDQLLPVPEANGWQMLKTEVSQALYSLIMGTNPSRNVGDLNPVDSVSWNEAKDFCKRLSWIMGKEVRLPTENEFRQALGRLRYVVLEEHVWSVSEANGIAQPVGGKKPFASGFHDLLGNVSEWLESIDRFENEDANHIGGHVQDRLEIIFNVPKRESARAERNRMTGFRVVVKM